MYFLFDIGGTKTRLGVSEDANTLSEYSVVNTPSDFEAAIKLYTEASAKIASGRHIEVAAVGIAGVLNKEKKTLIKSPNLSTWENKPLGKGLEQVLGCEVVLENDAGLAGLGEVVFGAGKNYSIVTYITVGTGIGGTRIVDGQIDRRVHGFEPGHQIIDVDGSVAGIPADLEGLVAGSGIKKRFKMPPENIKDAAAWEQITKYLAYGLHNTILHWSPEIVILGGGLIESNAISIDALNKHLGEITKMFPEVPRIIKSELGETSGLYGALQILRSKQ
jgi:glucokinase